MSREHIESEFCGRTRREFLWETGGGFTGLALTSLLSADGYFDRHAVQAAAPSTVPNPLAPKEPHFPAKGKAVICLFMYGGPSQMDLFDPKPELTKRNGEEMPNLDQDPLFKVRSPGKLMGTKRTFVPSGEGGMSKPPWQTRRPTPI